MHYSARQPMFGSYRCEASSPDVAPLRRLPGFAAAERRAARTTRFEPAKSNPPRPDIEREAEDPERWDGLS